MGAWEDGFAAGYDRGLMQGAMGRKPTIAQAASGRVVRTGAAPQKPRRRASAYSKRFGKAMKALKKKHPRTSFRVLVKKAHRQAKRGS